VTVFTAGFFFLLQKKTFVKVATTVASAVVLKRPRIPLFLSSLTTGGISLV
jgi:hypothetical protein